MPGPLLLLEEHVYNEACVLETAVMLSEISMTTFIRQKIQAE